MTATLDYLALLTAIRDNPGEDVPRLMLADELENTDPARAELIRVQCELARHPHGPDVLARNYDARDGLSGEWAAAFALAQRADIIIAVNGNRWRKGPACARCEGRGCHDHFVGMHIDNRETYAGLMACRVCSATGDTGGLLREFDYDTRPGIRTRALEPVRVHFRRGFIERVDVPALMDLLRTSGGVPVGEYRPSDWLRAVLTATPERELIREVVPLDFDRYLEERRGAWYWRDSNLFDGPTIPAAFCPTDQYHTLADAVAALGRAVVTWAREAVA